MCMPGTPIPCDDAIVPRSLLGVPATAAPDGRSGHKITTHSEDSSYISRTGYENDSVGFFVSLPKKSVGFGRFPYSYIYVDSA